MEPNEALAAMAAGRGASTMPMVAAVVAAMCHNPSDGPPHQ